MEHIRKQDFDFYIDRKVTIWVRERHYIKADSYEEAKQEMMEAFHDNMCSETFETQENLYDTQTDMEPGDNMGAPTAELYSEYEAGTLTTNTDDCWGCDWIAANNDSSYTGKEVCRKCGQKRTI
jgi:hypothetical protein